MDNLEKIESLKRQEYKYFVSNEEIVFLRQILPNIMSIDPNSNIKNHYKVTSLYFDNPQKDALDDKQSGVYYREKFRLRTYNSEKDLIKFECKQRANTAINKTSEVLPISISERLVNGDYSDLYDHESQFLRETYIKFISNHYKPSIIVEYDREAYFLPYGNIRITFDMNLRTYNSQLDILNLDTSGVPVFIENTQILEVKFSSELPDFLKTVLSRITGNRHAISKFVFGQKYLDSSQWRDRIHLPF